MHLPSSPDLHSKVKHSVRRDSHGQHRHPHIRRRQLLARAGDQATALSVVRNIVPLGRDLKDASRAHVVEIDVEEFGGESPILHTLLGVHPQRAVARGIVRFVQEVLVGDQKRDAEEVDVVIEVVVRHVQVGFRVGIAEVGRALGGAREGAVGGIEGRFPHLAEFVEDPWVCGLVGVVVHEDHDALSAQDHAGERGPVVERHGDLRGDVGVVLEAGLFEEGYVVVDFGVVAVSEEDGDYVEGV